MATKWGEHGIGEDPVKASNYPGKKLCERLSRREGHWSGKGQVNIEFRQNDVVPLEDDQQLEYKGSYGRVCRSILTVDEERIVVARKTMRLSDIPAKKIRDEVKILEDLKHRHLVTFIGSLTSRGFASILMYPFATCDLERLLQGLDEAQYHGQKSPVSTLLSELGWIQTGPKAAPWKPGDIFPHLQRICGCVCSALLYLHQRRIRHKDIKPSNVLVSKDGVYITDFNISKAFKSDLSSHTVGPYAGTMRYSAPECVYETGRSYPSDVYSLGLVFMEIYTYILGRPRSEMNDYTKSDLSLSKDSQIRHAALRILWVRVIFDGAGRGGFGTNSGMQELILRMISENQDARPEAFEVMSELWAHSPSGDFFCNECRKHKGCVGYKGLRKRFSELYKKYDDAIKEKNDLEKKLEQAREELKASRASNGPLSPSSELGPRKSPQLTSRSLSQVSVIRSPRTGPPVIRNKSGQRLDLDSLSYSHNLDKRNDDLIDTLNKVQGLKLCRAHYLTERCRNPNCSHQHDVNLTEEELEALRYLTRGQAPCNYGNGCTYPKCIYGHICPQGPLKRLHDCPFADDMHIRDTVPVFSDSLD
ncbi:kinase-like domain-containing protein [Aspergillus bertholletiae]|uniref:non-specific serine/threonine protein kinase n=1 Tax=Aspergillus bertholletiae TaxID=1226010 RepID=A0A5N7BFJ5_9EURO|nr:kinase-like domain-containing protein [Aspergillus bertholletiae]